MKAPAGGTFKAPQTPSSTSSSTVKAVTPADLFPGECSSNSCVEAPRIFVAAGPASAAVPSTAVANQAANDGDIWADSEVATKEDDSEVFKPDGRARPKYVTRSSVSAVTPHRATLQV